MTVAQQIENKVKLIGDGTVFSIKDLGLPAEYMSVTPLFFVPRLIPEQNIK